MVLNYLKILYHQRKIMFMTWKHGLINAFPEDRSDKYIKAFFYWVGD